jgi:hypothetical protein
MNDWHAPVLVSAQGLWWYSLHREVVSEKRLTIWTAWSNVHVKEHDAEGPDIRGGSRISRSDVITTLWRAMTRGLSVGRNKNIENRSSGRMDERKGTNTYRMTCKGRYHNPHQPIRRRE